MEHIHAKVKNVNIDEFGYEHIEQLMFENTDSDVLIQSENENIPSNIHKLSDLLSQLSTYAFRSGTDLVEKYAGHGVPPVSLKATPGDKYVDFDTGHIYEYRGLQNLQGCQKIPLVDKYICTQMGTTVHTHWDSLQVKNLTDDDLDTVGVIRRSRRIVYDLGKSTNLGKIELSFKNYSGYYKYQYVALSNTDPTSFVVGESHGMTWDNLVAGYGVVNGLSGAKVESNTIDDSGTGTISFSIDSHSHDARYISIWSDSTDVNVANLAIYSHQSEATVPTRWVLVDEDGPKIDIDTMIRFGPKLAPEQTDIGSICFVTQNNLISNIIEKTGTTTETKYDLSVKASNVKECTSDSTLASLNLKEYLDKIWYDINHIDTKIPTVNNMTYSNVTKIASYLNDDDRLNFLRSIGGSSTGTYTMSGDVNFTTYKPMVSGKYIATEEFVNGAVANYATKSYVTSQISAIPSPDLSTYSTKSYVDNKVASIKIPDVSGYATLTQLNNYIPKLTEDQNGIYVRTPSYASSAIIAEGSSIEFGSAMIYDETTTSSSYYSKFATNESSKRLDARFGSLLYTGAMDTYYGYRNGSGAMVNHFGYNNNSSTPAVKNFYGYNKAATTNSTTLVTNYFGRSPNTNTEYIDSVVNYFGSNSKTNYFGYDSKINYFGSYGSKITENRVGISTAPLNLYGSQVKVGDSTSRPVYMQGTSNKVVGTTSGYNTKMHFSATQPSSMDIGDVWFKLAE